MNKEIGISLIFIVPFLLIIISTCYLELHKEIDVDNYRFMEEPISIYPALSNSFNKFMEDGKISDWEFNTFMLIKNEEAKRVVKERIKRNELYIEKSQ